MNSENSNHLCESTPFTEDILTSYPDLLGNSTGFRIQKIIEDEKLLKEEIKKRNLLYKKYGRYAALTDGFEYGLILTDIIVGTLLTLIPNMSEVSSVTFSGVGLISGVAKLIQSRLVAKKLKHHKLSVIAQTTLNNLHHKISKAINDGQINHEEFEEIQSIMYNWKKGSLPSINNTIPQK